MDDPDGRLEGEYRDRSVWHRGRFDLRAADAGKVPDNVLATHYMSHFSQGEGLVLFPIGDPEPPERQMLLVPLDPDGFATLPTE